MDESVLQRILGAAKERLGLPKAAGVTTDSLWGGSGEAPEGRSPVDRQPAQPVSKEPPVRTPGAFYTEEELQALIASNPTKEVLHVIHMAKEVFQEAEILGPDNTDREAHQNLIQAREASKKPGCWNCSGLRFWTWPGGETRCARCHPPAEPGKVIWLDAQPS